jgi:Dyp-type peroxidase family
MPPRLQELNDTQGLIISAYGHLSCASYLLLHTSDAVAARTWLNQVTPDLTRADGRRAGFSLNLALTCNGLRALGLDQAVIDTFPVAFQQGMASERRQKILGDSDVNHPQNWDWGGIKSGTRPVHLLLLLYSPDPTARDEETARRLEQCHNFGIFESHVFHAAVWKRGDREHFGFLDGVGQPVIEGGPNESKQRARTGHETVVAAGEFILGYNNEYGVVAESPLVRDDALAKQYLKPARRVDLTEPGDIPGVRDLGRNGTYLVYRQIEQDVAAFWKYLHAATGSNPILGGAPAAEAVRLGAKFVGRWPSGAPLVKYADADPVADPATWNEENDFEYMQNDPHGYACPIGAHIRRANPRDMLGPDPQTALDTARRHRLLRRGRTYGDLAQDKLHPDAQERGLHFICLNSNIERQFEFVQQTWINNPVFAGLQDEIDPLVGYPPSGTMTLPGCPVRQRVHGITQFTRLRGGAYFFLPGLNALRYLAALSAKPT